MSECLTLDSYGFLWNPMDSCGFLTSVAERFLDVLALDSDGRFALDSYWLSPWIPGGSRPGFLWAFDLGSYACLL